MESAHEPTGHQGCTTLELSFPSLTAPKNLPSRRTDDREMDIDGSSDTTHDSLADSAYEIISAANTRSSDDEESHQDDSESLMSFDEASPHEHGNTHQDYVSPEASRVITPAPDTSEDEDNLENMHYAPRSSLDNAYSELTEGTILQTPRASTNLDPAILEDANGLTEISRTVDSSVAYIKAGKQMEHPRVSIHQTVAPSRIQPERTFRVLWHGRTGQQDEVIQKIGQALSVSGERGLESSIFKNSSSKFSIVPLSSFGSGESPEITMIPAGQEIIVDQCEACESNLENPIHPTTRHSKLRPFSDTPDLEIFFHSDENTSDQSFADIRPFTSHPFLDLRPAVSSFNIEPIQPCYGNAVHMRVDEAKHNGANNTATSVAIPIDVDHFQDLDPAMLNRNIQCLLDQHFKEDWKTTPDSFKNTFKELARNLERTTGASLWRILALVFITFLLNQTIYQSVVSVITSRRSSKAEIAMPTTQAIDTTATVTVTSTIHSTASVTPIDVPLINVPQFTPSPTGTREVGVPLHDAHSQSPFKFELVRANEDKLYLKLPLEVARLRRPPPIHVTAYVDDVPLEVVLSKQNASVYSLEVKDLKPSQPVTIVVDSDKASGARQAFHIDPRVSWNGMRSIELSLSACFATSRDVAQVARKELGLFRDQANGLILSSSDWLLEHMKNVRKSGGRAADLWERLSSRRDVIAKFVDSRHPQELLQSAREQAVSVNSALSQRITALMETGKGIEKSLVKKTDAHAKRLSERFQSLTPWRPLSSKDYHPLVEARNRAQFIARKAGGLIAAHKPNEQTKSCDEEPKEVYPGRASRSPKKKRMCSKKL